jgi:hypothetical protein
MCRDEALKMTLPSQIFNMISFIITINTFSPRLDSHFFTRALMKRGNDARKRHTTRHVEFNQIKSKKLIADTSNVS